MCLQLYQVQFSLGTGEHGHSSCCYGTGSQSQVGAQHGSQLPPGRVVVHEDGVKTGPEHPEEHRPWRAEAFLVNAMLRCLGYINYLLAERGEQKRHLPNTENSPVLESAFSFSKPCSLASRCRILDRTSPKTAPKIWSSMMLLKGLV